jgi:hypothetical protein
MLMTEEPIDTRPEPLDHPVSCFPAIKPEPQTLDDIRAEWKKDADRFERKQRRGFYIWLVLLVPYLAAVGIIMWTCANVLSGSTSWRVFGCTMIIIAYEWGRPYITYRMEKRADRKAAESE